MKTTKFFNDTTGEFLYGIAAMDGIEIHVVDEGDSIGVDFYAPCFGKALEMDYKKTESMAFILYSIKEIIKVIKWRLTQ